LNRGEGSFSKIANVVRSSLWPMSTRI